MLREKQLSEQKDKLAKPAQVMGGCEKNIAILQCQKIRALIINTV
jgi:hypothetical protein